MKKVLVLGTGGHAKVAADILLEMGHEVVGFLDDNIERHGQSVLGFPVLGAIASWQDFSADALALGIGANHVREALMDRYPNAEFITLIHPRATVSRFAKIGAGSMVAFGTCVGPDAVVGRGAIINTCSSVDHDCIVGDFAHIAVGATLAGHVEVGRLALIGAGCATRPGVKIGERAVVGAGAAIVRDIPAGITAVGVPARWE